MKPHWRTHDELPQRAITTALIAVRDTTEGERAPFIAGIYIWRNGRWECEETGTPAPETPFWWLPEDELLAELPQ